VILPAELGDLEGPVERRLSAMRTEDVPGRIWQRDHTLWREDPTEIEDRLGWLEAPEDPGHLAGELNAFAEQVVADGLTHALLLGMGGSSLAPEVLARTFGTSPGRLEVRVLDSTHPDAIARVEGDLPLDRTLFIVASKSGTTIETRSHMAYFLDRVGEPSRFVAVTDPGSPLADEAAGFLRVFRAPPDVGGRYSALTVFGLLPAALLGIDTGALLGQAAAAAARSREADPAESPAAVLGAVIGEAAAAGRDKCTLVLPDALAALGAWVEQLVAESTGKEGRGILPVDREPLAPADAYGEDRIFVGHGDPPPVGPWISLPFDSPDDLGTAFFVWELATAIAGYVLGIHPFDQPDVQAAKDATAEVLSSGRAPAEPDGDVDALLSEVRPGDYVAIQAFVDPTPQAERELQEARLRIRDRLRAATTLGFGPRFLHSTGQLHKGGPNSGVFVQVVEEAAEDRPIPGRDLTFGRLLAAQAAGDLRALRARGRRAARVPREALAAWSR
jgi:transaldolase/glucose-6-phosphate isomerase